METTFYCKPPTYLDTVVHKMLHSLHMSKEIVNESMNV